MAGNANSGRRKKSKALRDLHGSVERPHHRERPEPKYAVEVPDPPTSLDEIARREWDRVTALLHTQRVIARVDLANLAVYCTLFGRLEAIRVETRKKSFRLLRSGKEHPLLKMERQIAGQLRPYLTELGLTPASRARVSSRADEAPDDESDTFDRLASEFGGQKVVSIDKGRR